MFRLILRFSRKSTFPSSLPRYGNIENRELKALVSAFVETITHLCVPDHVYLCDGSQEEFNKLMELLVKAGVYTIDSPHPMKERASHSVPKSALAGTA